jgi:hypothetical protein
MNTRTCNKCDWVHFAVSRADAESEVARFNAYFDSLPKEKQELYYGGKNSSIEEYERCLACGNSYKDFRPAKHGDCPSGCTLNPIISEDVE